MTSTATNTAFIRLNGNVQLLNGPNFFFSNSRKTYGTMETMFTKAELFTHLKDLVAFNSVHSNPDTAAYLAAAGQAVADKLAGLGLAVTSYPTVDGSHVIRATNDHQPGRPTVMLYSHYDVVPAGDPALWETNPFTLTEKADGRWYGRGAADCKGNLVAHLSALSQALPETACNIIVLIEGSEEQGGSGLEALIASQPELFKADVFIILDSGNAATGRPTLTTSLRGGAQLTVKVETLTAAVHSGAFGGPAPDAVFALIRLLDSLRDGAGNIQIDGLNCLNDWDGVAYDPDAFRAEAGVLPGVSLLGAGSSREIASALWARPAISITGFTSTPVDQAVNAVPPVASARLNLRVPFGMPVVDAVAALTKHLENHVPFGAKLTVEAADLNEAFATDVHGPAVTAIAAALTKAYGADDISYIGSGGSIPLCSALMELNPEAELALFGVEDPACAMHAPNESVDPNEILAIAAAEADFLTTWGKS